MVAGEGRRLSLVRVAVALTVTVGVGYLAVDRVAGAMDDDESTAAAVAPPWFAPYVDVTLDPGTPFEDPTTAPVDDVVLSFVVADADHPCRPSWGGAYDLDEAGAALELDRRIVRLRQRGGDVVVAFGGAANEELATACEDVDDLARAYGDVVDRYDLAAVDLDIEGTALADPAATERRAEALAAVQAERAEAGTPLEVWLTLPVDPTGLPADAVDVVEATLAAGVDLAGVNAMTMDFGESRVEGQDMLDATVAALDGAHAQVAAAYAGAGQDLDDAEVWSRLGATPMIGQNDTPEDRFELADVEGLVAVAQERGLGRLSAWSLNRDQPCGPNDTGLASAWCSGTDAEPGAFSAAFAVVDGRVGSESLAPVTVPTGREDVLPDDPDTSPHPVWDDADAYAEGDRVVWRHNVYVAKWWNRDVAPDLPVEDAWDTPWRLIGPVLPGDHPPVVDLLAEGTHPAWAPDVVYHAGDVVQLDGIGYEARWWTEGDPPDAEAVDPFASPWERLPAD